VENENYEFSFVASQFAKGKATAATSRRQVAPRACTLAINYFELYLFWCGVLPMLYKLFDGSKADKGQMQVLGIKSRMCM